MSNLLTDAQWRARARTIQLVLTDNDGVLTDAGVYYSDQGEQLKRFSLRDGMGVELLRNAGLKTGLITREPTGIAQKRAEKLKMDYVYLGVMDKHAHLQTILTQTGLKTSQIAYIGDDVNDLEIIQAIGVDGLTAAPADAVPAILKTVHYICSKPGGHGAYRDFAEAILQAKGEL